MEVRPRKACSFSTSSRMLRRAAHQGPMKCSRWGAITSGLIQLTRPSVIALHSEFRQSMKTSIHELELIDVKP